MTPRGRQGSSRQRAAEIQQRLRSYLTSRYGSLEAFKRRAEHYGWFKRDTINRWFRGSRVPEWPTVERLKRCTGISADWLMTGVGPSGDPLGQLLLDALDAESRGPLPSLPVPSAAPLDAPSAPDYSGRLISPDLKATGKYRVIACRYCGAEFRQHLDNPDNANRWSPAYCWDCREVKVEIPRRREELARRKPTP